MDAVTRIVLALIAAVFGGGGVAAIITARAGASRADVDALRATLETLRDDAEQQRAQYIDEIQRLRERIEQLEADNVEHQRTIEKLRAQISRYEAEIARLTAKLAAYEQGQRA